MYPYLTTEEKLRTELLVGRGYIKIVLSNSVQMFTAIYGRKRVLYSFLYQSDVQKCLKDCLYTKTFR